MGGVKKPTIKSMKKKASAELTSQTSDKEKFKPKSKSSIPDSTHESKSAHVLSLWRAAWHGFTSKTWHWPILSPDLSQKPGSSTLNCDVVILLLCFFVGLACRKCYSMYVSG